MFYQPQFSQPMNQLIRVNGIEGAGAYQMHPNSIVALFDSNKDYFYIKQTDGAGFPTIRTFEFKEVIEQKQNEAFITREEMERYVEQLISESGTEIHKRTGKDDAGNSSKQRNQRRAVGSAAVQAERD